MSLDVEKSAETASGFRSCFEFPEADGSYKFLLNKSLGKRGLLLAGGFTFTPKLRKKSNASCYFKGCYEHFHSRERSPAEDLGAITFLSVQHERGGSGAMRFMGQSTRACVSVDVARPQETGSRIGAERAGHRRIWRAINSPSVTLEFNLICC